MSGFDHDLRDKILGFNAHLIVTQAGSPMTNYAMVEETIAKNKNVRGISPFVVGPVLVETQGDTNRPTYQDAPTLRGMDVMTDNNAHQLSTHMIAGELDLSGHGMIVGADFANSLRLRIGDHLAVYSSREIKKIRDALKSKSDYASLPEDYEVRGIFDVGYFEYDARYVITSLESAQDLYDLDDSVHGLLVTLNDAYQANAIKKQIETSLAENLCFDLDGTKFRHS